jgi:hypothetical protein
LETLVSAAVNWTFAFIEVLSGIAAFNDDFRIRIMGHGRSCQAYGFTFGFLASMIVFALFSLTVEPYRIIVLKKDSFSVTEKLVGFAIVTCYAILLSASNFMVGLEFQYNDWCTLCWYEFNGNPSVKTRIALAIWEVGILMFFPLIIYGYYKIYKSMQAQTEGEISNVKLTLSNQLAKRGVCLLAFMGVTSSGNYI